MGFRHKLQAFFTLPWKLKLLSLEALVLQLIVGLLLKLIPFRWIPRLFKNPSSPRPLAPSSPHSSLLIASQIKQAIQSTSPISPWRNKCLVQSLAARWMLRRRGMNSLLSLGVTHDNKRKIIAHAWLKTGDFEIVEKNGDYVEMYLF